MVLALCRQTAGRTDDPGKNNMSPNPKGGRHNNVYNNNVYKCYIRTFKTMLASVAEQIWWKRILSGRTSLTTCFPRTWLRYKLYNTCTCTNISRSSWLKILISLRFVMIKPGLCHRVKNWNEDQPAHPNSRIIAFVARFQINIMSINDKNAESILLRLLC